MPLINFSGIASGIDSAALIDATVEARRKTNVDPSKKRITELEDTNSAITELVSKLTELRSRLQKVSTLQGGALSKLASSTDETVASGTASPAAQSGAYTLTVSQLARNANFSFEDRFLTTSQAINSSINNGAAAADRTVTVEVGTGSNLESVAVVLTNSTTPEQFISSYNTSATKSVASLVNVGTASSPSYAIMITTNEQGLEEGQIDVSVGTEILTSGSGALTYDPLDVQQARDAQFTLSGIVGTISRPTNSVSDIIPGVNFSLQGLGTSTITVANDPDATKANISSFVEQWNAIVTQLSEDNSIVREEDGEEVENIFGPLSTTRVDDNALTSLRSALSTANSGIAGAVRIFADIGITTERDGTLKFDEDRFDAALSDDSNAVNALIVDFADTASLTGGTIDQFIRFNGLFDITKTSNTNLITDLNRRISDAEQSIAREKENMVARFARLESLMGRLQSQQSALSSALSSLPSR